MGGCSSFPPTRSSSPWDADPFADDVMQRRQFGALDICGQIAGIAVVDVDFLDKGRRNPGMQLQPDFGDTPTGQIGKQLGRPTIIRNRIIDQIDRLDAVALAQQLKGLDRGNVAQAMLVARERARPVKFFFGIDCDQE